MGRYSKVVVVGDARMSLLASADIREQLKDITQVILVPNLTLEGVLEVVQKEVVKEECPRGILLLCLAGLHGTLVECRVPEECRTEGHSDMQEMVPATKDDFLDPKFPKQLAKLKKKLLEALGRGSHVLFFPALPVDMAIYNAIAAKQHFDATGHKLSCLPETGSFNFQSFRRYTEAIDEVNGSSLTTMRLVPYEFRSKISCKMFMDDHLQDGFKPTLDLVERHIAPHLQNTARKHHTIRFQHVVLVGDARLGQVVAMQQQKGVEPCSFILQEEPGLRSLTPESPAVKQLSGMCDALIFLTVSPNDLGAPPRDKSKCFLPHDYSEALNNFLQEAQRVDQMLHLATHRCTIITTPVMPYNSHTLTRDKARKTSSCDKCRNTVKSMTHKIQQVANILGRKNALPTWSLNRELRDRGDDRSSSRHGSSLSTEVVRNAASTWENFLSHCQANIRGRTCVTITSVLQDPKVSFIKQSKTRDTSRTHSSYNRDKKQTHSSHSRDSKQVQSHHSRDKEPMQESNSRDKEETQGSNNRDKEQMKESNNKDKEQMQSSNNRDKEQILDSHSRDKEQTLDSHSRNKEQSHNDCSREKEQSEDMNSRDGEEWRNRSPGPMISPALDDITSPERQSSEELDSISTGNLSFTPSPCPSSINSPEDFVELSSNESPQSWRHSSTAKGSPRGSPKMRLRSVDSRDKSPILQRLDEPRSSFYQQKSYLTSRSRERMLSNHAYPSPDPYDNRGRSRSRSRSHGPRKRLYGRGSRSGSPLRLSLSPKRKPVYRRSLSRSLSPLPCYRSIPGGASFGKGRRSTSRGRRSFSRSRRSISRGRRSVCRDIRSISKDRSVSWGKRSNSRGRRSISRGRSISRDRSAFRNRQFSKGRRSLSRGRRSISRGRRSISRGKRSGSRGRRSISRGRRSVSRSRRSISRGKRSVSSNRRSISRGKRSISWGRRSISRDRRSVSRSRRSVSRGKRSVSRGRKGRSSSREQHNTIRLPGHTPFTQQEKLRRNTVEEALKTLRSVHEKECEMYRSNPTIHPDIGAEYRRFCDKKIQSIVALGGDPTQYNMASEWQTFWDKRMEEIFLESWNIKKEQCLKVLDNQKRQSSPRPSVKTRRSSSVTSSSSSSSFSSSSSSSSSCGHNRKRSKKKKRKKKVKRKSSLAESVKRKRKSILSENSKRKRKSSVSESGKRKKKKRSTEMPHTKSHPRGKLAERKPSCSNEYQESFPRDHSKTTLPEKGDIKKDCEMMDSTVKKVPDRSGEVRQEEQVKKPAEAQVPNYPEVAQPSKGEQSQGAVLSCKEKINRKQSSPPQINRQQPSPPQVSRQQPSPPQVNRQLPSPPQINRQQPSPPKINRQQPSPPQIAGMRQQWELDEECRKWRLPSPLNQPAVHSESQQHTSKPGIRGVMSMGEPVPSATGVMVEARVEQPGKDRVSPHDIVQRLWLQLSGKKCVGGSSGNSEASASEAQRQHSSRGTLDSKMKEGNLTNTICSEPQGRKEQPAWQEALSFLTSIQKGGAQQDIHSMDTKQPVNRVTATVPPNQVRDMKSGYSLSSLGEKETQEACGSGQHYFKSTTQPLSIFSSNTNSKPSTSTNANHSTASEAQGKQGSTEHLQSNMKEKNVKNTVPIQPQGNKEQLDWQEALSFLTSIQEGRTHQGILKTDTKQPVNRVTATVPPNQARDMKTCHNLSHIEEKEPQKACNTLRSANHGSESTTQTLNSFTANTSTKPADAKNTKHSCQDDVSSTTALDKSTNVDVMKVLEVLIHLEDKLGTHCVPLKLLQMQAKDLQSNGIDPVTIMNDKDNMLLLQMIQEKLQGILKDSKLSIIKKFIVQEAEQRLSVLLDLHKHHKLLGGLSLTEVAHRCRDMDATAMLSYICDMLQHQGHTHVPQEQLVNLYKSVKAEQRILGRSCRNKRVSTTTTLSNQSESSHSQLSGGSGSLPHGSTFKVAFVGHEYVPTHFQCSGCEVRLYRAPGGKVQHFSNDPRMNKVLQWPHDLTILFLGSNDIYENCEAIAIVDKIIQVADLIRGTCDSKLAITLIEPRNIRYCDWISQELYDMVSTTINRKLQTDMKEQCFIDVTAKLNAADLQKDRMYWNDKGRTLVDNEFRNIILKFKHIHEVIQSVIG